MKWIFVILGVILLEITRLMIAKKGKLGIRSKQLFVGTITIFSSILIPYLVAGLAVVMVLEGLTLLIGIYLLYKLNLEKEQV